MMVESQSHIDDPEMILSPEEAQQLYQSISSETEFSKKIRIKQAAKSRGVSEEDLYRELKLYVKERIREKEKGNLRHYHRTSLERLEMIAKKGRFLSRSKLQEEEPELELPGWSASDDVMITRDKFNKEGTLALPGLSEDEVVGGSGNDVVLVLKEEIMDLDDYDALSLYPTVSDAPLKGNLEVVLVEKPENLDSVKKIMTEAGLKEVPVVLRSEWIRE